MKLKYYLRGLGIGMLVVALLLTVSGSTGAKMSDEAVKRRAAELGMVEKDKTVLGELGSETVSGETAKPESDVSEPDKKEEAPEEPAEADENAAQRIEQPEEDENAAKQQIEQPEEDAAEQNQAQDIEERADEVADRAEEIAENAPAGRVVTLEVRRGDSSVSVARRAAEAGLVQSAADFDVFLCRNGYDKRISVGNYEITEGASEKEIADIITKSR